MPNWVENRIEINGEKTDLLHFKNLTKGKEANYALSEHELRFYSAEQIEKVEKTVHEFTFNSLLPVPQDVLKQGYSDAGYHWQTNHWGTKWDVAGSANIEEEANKLIYTFQTAWSPPIKWFQQVSEMFPNLSFSMHYDDEGGGFAGTTVIEKGEVMHDEDVSNDEESYKAFLINVLGHDKEMIQERFYDEES
jgi:hypothetical protein